MQKRHESGIVRPEKVRNSETNGAVLYGEVREVEQLSLGMVRLILGGGNLDGFEASEATDSYIKAQFQPVGATYGVPWETEDLDGVDPDRLPRPRRVTVRRWNDEAQELTLDFATHGEAGFMGPWAKRATVGDRLQFSGPGGSYRPNLDVDWHLFVGDESAIPAIAASLESLPETAHAVAVLVVDAPGYEVDLGSLARVDLTWLYRRDHDSLESILVDALAGMDLPGGTFDVFVHGEAGETRAVRKHLISDRGVDPTDASISAYWRRRMTDEEWRDIKKEWNAAQEADV